jgi:hypothetical protein
MFGAATWYRARRRNRRFGAGHLGGAGVDGEDFAREFAVWGEVVFAAEQVVVGAGDVGPGGVERLERRAGLPDG